MEELNPRKHHCSDCGALPPVWREKYTEGKYSVWHCDACDAYWQFDTESEDHMPSENSEVLKWLESVLEGIQHRDTSGAPIWAMDVLDEMIREYKFLISKGMSLGTYRQREERRATETGGVGEQG